MSPLVCIFAHPDDESFGPGGTIAKFAKDRDVYLICVTSGDADPQFTNHDSNGLGNMREQELLEAARILGVKKVDFLRFKDGSLCNNNYHAVAAKIREKLDEYRPGTVMTFDFNGVSGHLDHVAVTMITCYVVQKLSYVQDLLLYCENKDFIAPIRKDYFVYVPQGYTRDAVDLIVDYTDEWDTVVKAMYAHQSQKGDADWILDLMSKHPKEQYFIKLTNPV
jgi:N-acetylglucosamine malate deacetylase 2